MAPPAGQEIFSPEDTVGSGSGLFDPVELQREVELLDSVSAFPPGAPDDAGPAGPKTSGGSLTPRGPQTSGSPPAPPPSRVQTPPPSGSRSGMYSPPPSGSRSGMYSPPPSSSQSGKYRVTPPADPVDSKSGPALNRDAGGKTGSFRAVDAGGKTGSFRAADTARLALPVQVTFKFRYRTTDEARAAFNSLKSDVRSVLRKKSISPTLPRGAKAAVLEFTANLMIEDHIGVAKSLIYAGGELLGLLADDPVLDAHLRARLERMRQP